MNDILIFTGDAVKALGGGKVGGYLARFTAKGDYDLTGDRFDAATDFGDADKFPVLFNHGMDTKMGRKRIGGGTIRRDEVGLWIEAQLQQRNEYEQAIYALAEQGKLSWSSGAAAHTVERETEGKGAYIKQWYLSEASLTPTPAEPRNAVISIKSLEAHAENVTQATDKVTAETVTSGAADVTADALDNNTIHAAQAANEVKEMDENEIKTAPQNEKVAELEKQLGELKAKIEAAPATNSGAPAIKKVTNLGFKDDEVKAFLHYVRTGDEVAYKAAMQEDTASEGGYAVPSDFAANISAKRSEVSVIRQMGISPLQTTLEHYLFPTEGTAMTKAIVTAEEASYDENEPTLGQTDVVAYKHTKLIKISEELEADAKANFGGWLSQRLGAAFGLAENYAFFNVASNGSSKPASVTYRATTTTAVASQTAFTAAELLTLVYSLGSAYTDNMKLVMRRSTLGKISALTGNPFAFQPTPQGGGNSNTANGQWGTIHNIPVFVTDDLPAQAAANKPVLLFNPDYCGWIEREGYVVTRNPYLYQATGQIGLFAKARFGHDFLQADAAYVMVSAT